MAETVSVVVWPHNFDNAAIGTHVLHMLFGTYFRFAMQDAAYAPTLMPTHTFIEGHRATHTTMDMSAVGFGTRVALDNFALEA